VAHFLSLANLQPNRNKKYKDLHIVGTALIVVLAIVVFATTLTHAVGVVRTEPETPMPARIVRKLETATSSLPVRLLVPRLGINANVQKVGISKRGTMGVPNNFTDVGWYKYGTIPGKVGNAVLDGHLDNALSLDGVFKHLSDLVVDDDIFVVNAAGNKARFKVAQSGVLASDSTSTDGIFGTSTKARLILITCEGVWQQSKKTYTERRVVYADFAPGYN
jgi:hypothetical protein